MHSTTEINNPRKPKEERKATKKRDPPSRINTPTFSKRPTSIIVVLVLLASLIGMLLYAYGMRTGSDFPVIVLHVQVPDDSKRPPRRCPDVLKYMTQGHWISRTMTDDEHRRIQDSMKLFHSEDSRRSGHITRSGKCGNVTYSRAADHRTMCDPEGPAPCCFRGVCAALPVESCRCRNCFDLRQRIHAEFSSWQPANRYCPMKTYSASEVCHLLKGYSVYVIGDSLLRHFHQALLIVMTNGSLETVYRSRLSKERRQLCKDMNIFTLSKCKLSLKYNSTNMCNGTVNIYYRQHTTTRSAPELYDTVKSSLGKEKHLFIVSHGLHDNHDITKTRTYVLPTLQLLKISKVRWPQFVWLSYHAPGLAKSPRYKNQGYLPTKRYNEQVRRLLLPFGVPILDTFNMTENTFSYDGTHYGMGVVTTKVHLLCNYIEEQQRKLLGRHRTLP